MSLHQLEALLTPAVVGLRVQLNDLRARHWQKWRVEWDTYPDHGHLHFCNFGNYGVKGNGRRAFAEICHFADKHGFPITLWTDVPKLFPYYENFGFKQTYKLNGRTYFIRQPGG